MFPIFEVLLEGLIYFGSVVVVGVEAKGGGSSDVEDVCWFEGGGFLPDEVVVGVVLAVPVPQVAE